ncbi:MAG TPA: ATP-binding protein, partial [Kofleriaceae bacterium]|nr:ATP-binding protein [Kofleriaceae bacterium]
GNVLNSVNVSATLAADIVSQLQTGGLAKAAALIADHRDDLERFLRDDPRGQKLPDYFSQLQEVLERDKSLALGELKSLIRNLDHIKIIVRAQQSHVKPGAALETFEVQQLIDDALKLSAPSREHGAIEIVRDVEPLPPVRLDRHKALQILVNLLTNARDAVMASESGPRKIVVHARRGTHGNLEIAVEDNGCGVDPQNLERIFQLGFTTKAEGNGLGLHFSACAALELHGKLSARSEGRGHGASFLLELPLEPAAAAA